MVVEEKYCKTNFSYIKGDALLTLLNRCCQQINHWRGRKMYYALYPRFLNLQSKNIEYYCLATVDVFPALALD